MRLDEFTLTIIFLFFPGLVCALIVSRLTTHKSLKPVEYVIPTLVYGLLVYVIYSWLAAFSPQWLSLPHVNILSPKSREIVSKNPTVLTTVTFIAIVLSFVASASLNWKLLHRFSRFIRITNKFGDRDVWNYVMNSKGTEWLVVRAPDQGIYYEGRIAAYSDDEDVRELLLMDTKAYDNINGSELYDAGYMYFSFPNEGITLELPQENIADGQPKRNNDE